MKLRLYYHHQLEWKNNLVIPTGLLHTFTEVTMYKYINYNMIIIYSK